MSSNALIVISAPSGAGKTTIAGEIRRQFPALRFSISATTRARRNGEEHGVDYFFLSDEEFEEYMQRNAFAEWETVFEHRYGTLKSEIDRVLRERAFMLFDIDVKGALSLRTLYPDDTLLIFIQPPDMVTLQRRLVRRNTNSAEDIRSRLERAAWEMDQRRHFDHVIINDNLQTAIDQAHDVVARAMAARRTIQRSTTSPTTGTT